MAQQRVSFGDGFQHLRRAVTILNVGPETDNSDQQSNRVGDDMTLAALDPFPCIKATNPSAFSGFHALAVNDTRCDTRCRAGLAPHRLTRPTL